jgi:acetoin utilization protein AcuB
MNVLTPVSKIMTSHLQVVLPNDPLSKVKELFDTYRFHHIPVVYFKKVVGIISRADFQAYYTTLDKHFESRFINAVLLNHHTAEEIMSTRLAKLNPEDRLNVAIEIFKDNLIHALPVVNADDELVGIVTTHDLIQQLAKEKINDLDYQLSEK